MSEQEEKSPYTTSLSPDLTQKSVWFGSMEMTPQQPVVAGTYHTWALTYTVGEYGIDNGGEIRLSWRLASDMATPQSEDPKADHYVTATSSNPNATVNIHFIPDGGLRPFSQILVFTIANDSLAAGDQIYITMGNTSYESRGQRVQTFVDSDFRFLAAVECFQTGSMEELDDDLLTPITAGKPDRMVALSPSCGTVNQSLAVLVKCEDSWGNPTARYRGKTKVSVEKVDGNQVKAVPFGEETYDFTEVDQGCHRFETFTPQASGMYRFKIEGSGLTENTTFSNTFKVTASERSFNHYWGDLHAQFNNSTGTGSVEEAFTFARDAAGIDFTGHQPNDFLLSEEGWNEAKDAVGKLHVPGQFVPFLGYEWSANTPAGGDRNVHYLGDDGPLHRTSHWQVADKSDINMDRYPLETLYQSLDGRNDVILVPHVGGRRCDITRNFDPELEPVVEICSVHGRFEWLLREALENGYTVGVIGGSDDHTGRPGAAYPTSSHFGTRGGLAGVYAKELTREGIFSALKARHCYATTGERILLQVETTDGKVMGDSWRGRESPMIHIQTAGTRPIERLDIFRNQERIDSYPIFDNESYSPNLVRIEWGGARIKGRSRNTNWDGRVCVEKGHVKRANTFAFDHPDQGITQQDDQTVSWNSSTSGDHDGLVLELDESNETIFHFHTDLVDDTIALSDLKKGPVHKDCGGVGQYYQFSLQPTISGPRTIDFQWKDPSPVSGRNAYWIRVVQEDGETAWSSPLYFQNIN